MTESTVGNFQTSCKKSTGLIWTKYCLGCSLRVNGCLIISRWNQFSGFRSLSDTLFESFAKFLFRPSSGWVNLLLIWYFNSWIAIGNKLPRHRLRPKILFCYRHHISKHWSKPNRWVVENETWFWMQELSIFILLRNYATLGINTNWIIFYDLDLWNIWVYLNLVFSFFHYSTVFVGFNRNWIVWSGFRSGGRTVTATIKIRNEGSAWWIWFPERVKIYEPNELYVCCQDRKR